MIASGVVARVPESHRGLLLSSLWTESGRLFIAKTGRNGFDGAILCPDGECDLSSGDTCYMKMKNSRRPCFFQKQFHF